jgi:hypothetical protein
MNRNPLNKGMIEENAVGIGEISAEESASETEDEDGHGKSAQLFEEGVSEAAHDRMLQAAKAAAETDINGS